MKKIDLVIEYLNEKLIDEYTELNDLVGCFIDIKEDLKDNDLKHLNYKLFCYFSTQCFYIGNETNDGDLYVNDLDITKDNIFYCLDKAIDYVMKSY